MLVVVIADDHIDAVAVRALLRSAPATELVGRRPDRAVTLSGGSLDLEPALATISPADRVVVDRGVETAVHAADLLAHTSKSLAGLDVADLEPVALLARGADRRLGESPAESVPATITTRTFAENMTARLTMFPVLPFANQDRSRVQLRGIANVKHLLKILVELLRIAWDHLRAQYLCSRYERTQTSIQLAPC